MRSVSNFLLTDQVQRIGKRALHETDGGNEARPRSGAKIPPWQHGSGCRAAKKLANVLAHCNRPDSESRPQRIFGVAVRPSLVL